MATVVGAKYLADKQSPELGSLQIDSIPSTEVVIDGKAVGKTPYLAEKIKPGEYQIKLQAWENKVKVLPGVLTYVSQELASLPEDSAGQILTLEKLPTDRFSELAVVSDPDGASVSIDGLEKGRASAVFKDLTSGDKVVIISLSGYADQIIHARLVAGFRLNAIVKLRKLTFEPQRQIKSTAELIASPSSDLTETSALIASSSATVKDNPLGFVRVRKTPDYTAEELGKIYPGEKYPVMMQNDNWVEIRWKDKEGWVAKDYLLIT